MPALSFVGRQAQAMVMDVSGYDFASNIHLFSVEGDHILVDVNSGAIHLLDGPAREFVTALIENQGDAAQASTRCRQLFGTEAATEVEDELKQAYDDQTLFTPVELPILNLEEMPVKALCLNVAHLCNMRCTYCFARQGDFGTEKGLMSEAVGRQALDFLISGSQDITNLEVDFFGGEPLLNWDVVCSLVAYGRKQGRKAGKNMRFTLTTNALLLDEEKMDYLVEEGISVILSLDGRREVNDRCRLLNNGQGSYDVVLPRIQQMVARNPVSYYVRGTFSRGNLDFTQDLEHLIACGFTNLSLEPAVGPYEEFAIGEEVIPRVLEEYDRLTRALWAHYQAGQEINYFHFNLDLARGPCLARRLTGCGAGGEYLAITPGGDIYPCHQFIGEEEFLMGNVETGITDPQVKQRLTRNYLSSKAECRKCWARFYCGGGCHANAYFSNGCLEIPARTACAMHRKRVECAIYLEIEKIRSKAGHVEGGGLQ